MLSQAAVYFGYLASVCLVISLIVTNDLKFRWYNALGTVFFILYALILKAYPVLLTNGILFLINVYYLFKIYSRKENFDHALFEAREELPQKYLRHYSKEIKEYFPQFDERSLTQNLNIIITRNLDVATLWSASIKANGDALIHLNFTIPRFRDYKVGGYIFDVQKQFLLSRGIKRIVYEELNHKGHIDFLNHHGFKSESIDGKKGYIRIIQ